MEKTRKRLVFSLEYFVKNKDVILPFAVIGILIIMVLPLPTWLMDILLATNITFSIVVLMIGMYTDRALDFSIFPSLLLILTLFRLALNVATTRLILMHGNEGITAAGHIIASFGNFVVGGNYVIGFVVFCILVIINFMVITKGSNRIAEVAARFTLDAMPGKQMSIDADLNAGIIDEKEAKRRRLEIMKEADFYGAMDGASKFVRGDAIAGIIITLINIAGGLIIGVFQQGLSLKVAAQTYTLLTIGDGLVSQIPALIISTAAGIIITRAASDTNLGDQFAEQLSFQPKALYIASIILLIFGILPGLPTVPFILLGIGTAGLAYFSQNIQKKAKLEELEKEEMEALPEETESIEALLPLDLLALEIGYGLIYLVDKSQNGELLDRIKALRRQIAIEMGFVVPPIHIRDNLELKPAEYNILLKGVSVGGAELMLDHWLAMNPGTVTREIEGIKTKEPVFGLPALWITEDKIEEAKSAGYTVVDLATVIATHLSEIIKNNAPELLGRREVQQLLDNFAIENEKLVNELIPGILNLGTVQKVLQNLLREKVSIRDLRTILETLADVGQTIKDADILTEFVRQALGRMITNQYKTSDNTLPVITFSNEIENTLYESIKKTEQGEYLAIDPALGQFIINKIQEFLPIFIQNNYEPVLLTSPGIRPHIRKYLERFIPNIAVLSYNEIVGNVQIKSIGVIKR